MRSTALLASVACAIAAGVHGGLPLPTPAQLKYQLTEIVALTHFNM